MSGPMVIIAAFAKASAKAIAKAIATPAATPATSRARTQADSRALTPAGTLAETLVETPTETPAETLAGTPAATPAVTRAAVVAVTLAAVLVASMLVSGGCDTEDNDWSLVAPDGDLDLVLNKTVDDASPIEGQVIAYSLTVRNDGPADAREVAVIEALPAGVAFVSASVTRGSYSDTTGVWTVGAVAEGDSVLLVLRGVVEENTSGQTITNSAAIFLDGQVDADESSNRASAAIMVSAIDVALAKTVDRRAPIEGELITYVLTLTNHGPGGATGIAVSDRLPAGLAFQSADPSQGTYDEATAVWTAGDLEDGATATLAIAATIDLGTGGERITNTAAITALEQLDSDPGNDESSVDMVVGARLADISVDKSVTETAPDEGQQITYTVTVSNAGPEDASGLYVTDQLPAGVTFRSAEPSQGTYSKDGGLWAVGNLAATASASLNLDVTVDAGTSGSIITNSAAVTALEEVDLDEENDHASVDIRVNTVDLALDKTVSNAGPVEGETISYTITVANDGPGRATEVRVTDRLPAGVTHVGDSPSQGSYAPVSGVWTVGSIEAGAQASLVIDASVDAGTAGATIVNTTTLTNVAQIDTEAGNDSDAAAITPGAQVADLEITKTVTDSTPSEGQEIAYTVTVRNRGPQDATGVVVTDQLPAGVELVSVTPSGAYDAQSGLWTVGDVPASGSAALALAVRVNAGTSGLEIVNTAAVTALDQVDNEPGNDADSVTLLVDTVDLQIDKSASDAAPLEGTAISYTVRITNGGEGRATSVQVRDQLPTGISYRSHTASRGTYSAETSLWNVGSLASGADATLVLEVTVDVGASGRTIVNTATVANVDQPDSDPGNDSDTATIRPTPQQADLALTKSASHETVDEGGQIVYTVSVRNNGPQNATGVVVTDELPATLELQSANPSGAYDAQTGLWTVGGIGESQTATLTLTAAVKTGTSGLEIVNTAAVTALDQADEVPANDSDSVTILVNPVDLQIAKSVSNEAPAEGASIFYTVRVTNHGPGAATSVRVRDQLPDGVSYTSYAASRGTYNPQTSLWNLGALAADATATLILNVTVDAGTTGQTIFNTASVANVDQVDSNPANDSDTVTIEPARQRADLAVTKTASRNAVDEGGQFVYTVTVRNNGPQDATGVVVTDELPAGLELVSATPSGAYDAQAGRWMVGTVANSGTATLSLTVAANAGTSGLEIVNTAVVTALDQLDGVPGNDSDSVTIRVNTVDLQISKSVDDAAPLEGATVSYTVRVTNDGPGGATSVQVGDQLPAGVSYASHSASQGSYTAQSGQWSVGPLASEAEATLVLAATVDVGTSGQTIVNTASVTDVDQVDSNPANDSDTATISPDRQLADLALTKTASPASVDEGGQITYTVTVRNDGPQTATTIFVADDLPSEVNYTSSSVTRGVFDPAAGRWAIGSLAIGASATLTIDVTARSGTSGQTIENTASVVALDQADDNPSNDSDAASVLVNTVDLRLAKTVDVLAPAEGQLITYEVVVTNEGPGAATGVAVEDDLPGGVTYESASPSRGSYSGVTGAWSVGSLAADASATLLLRSTVDAGTAGTTITNAASVAALDQLDPDSSNDSAAVAIVPVLLRADLVVGKSVDDPRPEEDDKLEYTVTVRNAGPHDATGVVVTDRLPEGVSYARHSATRGTYDRATGVWDVGSLENGAEVELTLHTVVEDGTEGQTITNTATATGDQPDPNPENNSASVDILVEDD
ncbi:MAG: DUF11 domain-containing protein [Candidatus Krumholzibacteriia bacterium]